MNLEQIMDSGFILCNVKTVDIYTKLMEQIFFKENVQIVKEEDHRKRS